MNERMTDARLAELKHFRKRGVGMRNGEADELFAEIDALRAERDEASKAFDAYRWQIGQLQINNESRLASAAVTIGGLVAVLQRNPNHTPSCLRTMESRDGECSSRCGYDAALAAAAAWQGGQKGAVS